MAKIAKTFIFLCMATILLVPDYASGQQNNFAGSYEMIICAGICSFESNDNVILKGHFVLFDEPIDQDMRDRLWAEFEASLGTSEPTACFEMAPPNIDGTRGKPRGNLGAYRNGFTAWRKRRDSSAVEFDIFRSIDARCQLRVEITESLSRGKVTNEFMDMKEFYDVTARRIGKPDVNFCVPQP
jgi:hypothetical protein